MEYVVFYSLVGGLFSLLGGILLLLYKKRAERAAKLAAAFAGGALLAAAFMDVLPEAIHSGEGEIALRWTVVGILAFFLLERFLHWFHRHSDQPAGTTIPLIIIGDTVHNFIDGIAIAAAFLVDVPTGIITTLAVAAHEIPQEIGDFGLLLSKGMSRVNVIKANIASSLATTVAAVGFYALGNAADIPLGVVLGIVAGFFIYIAVSDILPAIHSQEKTRFIGLQTVFLIVGILVVGIATTSLHGLIDGETHDHQTTEQHHEHE